MNANMELLLAAYLFWVGVGLVALVWSREKLLRVLPEPIRNWLTPVTPHDIPDDVK